MLWPPRRALLALAAASAIALAGCGGAGYGEPIAGTDAATVALAPAPVTTPGVTTIETRPTDATSASRSTSSGGASPRPTTTDEASSDAGSGDASGGSGGSSGDTGGGSALAAYAADVNRFCTGFNSATRTLTTEIGAAGAENPRALGRAIVRYGSAIDDAADGLRAAPPPASAASFHQRTLGWVSGVTSAISANRSGLNSGDRSAGASVIGKVQGLGRPPTAPASLRARATACTA